MPLESPFFTPAHAASVEADVAKPLLAVGEVRHTRLRPTRHAFRYPTHFVLLPMRALSARPDLEVSRAPKQNALVRNRFGWLSFHDADHGQGGPDALAWLLDLLNELGVQDADGEIWLQTYPRVLGYAFKPVSFWYCHRTDGSLRAVVAEVNNTFGERHCYLLDGDDVAFGATLTAHKVFHVSPFCAVQGGYRFRFMRTQERIVARVEHVDAHGPLITTSVSGTLEPLTKASARQAVLRQPWMTLGVILRIHWQAVRLALKRVPFHSKPAPPTTLASR